MRRYRMGNLQRSQTRTECPKCPTDESSRVQAVAKCRPLIDQATVRKTYRCSEGHIWSVAYVSDSDEGKLK
jgi:hypothetical protein